MHHGVSIRVGQQLQHALRVWPQQLARIEFVLRLHDNTHASPTHTSAPETSPLTHPRNSRAGALPGDTSAHLRAGDGPSSVRADEELCNARPSLLINESRTEHVS